MQYTRLYQGSLCKEEVMSVHFDLCCDVLVVGAGCAGIYCADSAKREGADVILLEVGENIGGMFACGNVTGYYYGGEGGAYLSDDEKTEHDHIFVRNGSHWEQRQIHMTERLTESGVSLLTSHSVLGLYLDGCRVVGVRAFDGKNILDIGATFTVDATSDGHLVRMTDANMQYGREPDGRFVPFTVRGQYVSEGILTSCNTDSGTMNHYDREEFSYYTVLSHANASSLLQKGEFVNLGLHTGVREGLTYEGEDRVRYEDILFEKEQKRVLFYAYSDLDRHGADRASEAGLFQNFWVISNLSTVTIPIGVPMGALIPKGMQGFVTAGRCLSCDTYSQSAIRMNRDMFRMGECLGVALAMATKTGVELLEIDYDAYLGKVMARGAFDGGHPKGFYFDNSYSAYKKRMHSLGKVPDEKYAHYKPTDHVIVPVHFSMEDNLPLLRTDAPGVAIWSCFRAPDRVGTQEKVYSLLSSADTDLYRYNCAIALGLLGDARAVGTLREIVENRDCFFFTENRRSNQFRSAIAICLLGRLGGVDELPLLFELLEEKEIERAMYHTLKPNYLYYGGADKNFVYFSVLTHTCVAIRKIYQRCGLSVEELKRKFEDIFRDGSRISFVTTTSPGENVYEAIAGFIKSVCTF